MYRLHSQQGNFVFTVPILLEGTIYINIYIYIYDYGCPRLRIFIVECEFSNLAYSRIICLGTGQNTLTRVKSDIQQ